MSRILCMGLYFLLAVAHRGSITLFFICISSELVQIEDTRLEWPQAKAALFKVVSKRIEAKALFSNENHYTQHCQKGKAGSEVERSRRADNIPQHAGNQAGCHKA